VRAAAPRLVRDPDAEPATRRRWSRERVGGAGSARPRVGMGRGLQRDAARRPARPRRSREVLRRRCPGRGEPRRLRRLRALLAPELPAGRLHDGEPRVPLRGGPMIVFLLAWMGCAGAPTPEVTGSLYELPVALETSTGEHTTLAVARGHPVLLSMVYA